MSGIRRVEGQEREVVDDEQVDPQQLADLDVVAVVEPGRPQPAQRPVAALEVHAVAATHAGSPSKTARNVLPTPTGPMITTLRPPSMKRSEHSSVQVWRS
ncbi:MAG: hypothetical protein M3326_08680 [Actinomycetota bacterium]|nr:hypothetical protein [Actinomycetota bacterium]